MPIYMDRHDVSEKVTAENVAQLHQADLKIQDRFDCRGLTYWFDAKRKTAFCLIEAPDMKAIHKMHQVAHGAVPNKIIEVNTTIVESFLGRIEDPEKSQNAELNIINDPAFRTIMTIELKLPLQLQKGSSSSKMLLTNIVDIILKLLKGYEGSIVKQTNSNYLVSFKSVSNAVKASLEIQLFFQRYRKEIKDDRSILKIGLSAGVPVTGKESFFEEAIKQSKRMCEFIKGNIVVSSEVKELYNSENPVLLNKFENIVSLSLPDENFLTLLMDFTESEWSNVNLKVNDFIKPVRCSKSQMYRKMVALTGKSPNAFIRDFRLDQALQLLRKNSVNISGIAFETGFSSPSYFSKCFQKRFGMLPSDYVSS